ncbi:PR-1-like protein [Mycena belliarum]|uniref:PR-1-like protein n=1 Tax=Mycena belliarum TaxID=1033014 RepID=A0AAD6U993_9AGAR|nr:PR-1-like protein [Mycena belliae]
MNFILTVLAFASLALALATPNTHTPAPRHRSAAAARGLLDILTPPSPDTSAYLWEHNKVRLAHAAPLLTWNATLAAKAAQWANTCQVKHSGGSLLPSPYGENVVAATGAFPIAAAMSQFTVDSAGYDPAKPAFSHFTQVVWKATTQLGCAKAQCNDVFDPSLGAASYYVCLYYPPGNVIGQAAANVKV